jgi:hypothetical protein
MIRFVPPRKHRAPGGAIAVGLLGVIAGALALTAATATADEGVLVIEVDSPCSILIDDVFYFRLEPDSPREVTIEEGDHDLAALSVEARGVMWQDMIQVEEDERLEVDILIGLDVEAELEAIVVDDRSSRLEVREDGTALDPETELEWTCHDNHFDVDWETSQRYCETLRLAVPEGDNNDDRPWRLPTIEELESLVDDRSRGDYRVLGRMQMSGCCVWSSEDYGSVSAWYMDFDNGRKGFVARDYTDGGRVLCVR